MKYFLAYIITLSSIVISACPACNIHNYLSSSIKSSSQIYKGKVLRSIDNNKALIIVESILKKDSTMSIEIGDSIQEYVYDAFEKIGKSYIFSNPMAIGIKFPILDHYFEEEIKLIIKDSSLVNVNEALILLNGVSSVSNRKAWIFFEGNKTDSISNLLLKNLTLLLDSCKLNKDYPFYDHRIRSNVSILLKLNDNHINNGLINLIYSINYSEYETYEWTDKTYNKQSGAGSFLRYLIEESSKIKSFQKKVTDILESEITKNKTSEIQFFAYGLSFLEEYKWNKKFKELSIEQKKHISKGIFLAAIWYRFWFRSDKVEILKKQAINFDSSQKDFINDRLKD